MKIETKTSVELSYVDWETHTASFNKVFSKHLTVNDFKHKYLNTIDGLSYHALLKVENIVVGGLTVIPYEYFIEDSVIRIGLTVDVFIIDEHRVDLMSLSKMYKKIKELLILRDFTLVITNPNDNAYFYWKKIVKFQDVGHLNYFALPLKISNVVSRLPKVLNLFTIIGSKILLTCSYCFHLNEKVLPIRLNRSNNILETQRYTSLHKTRIIKNVFFSYRIVDEDGVNTCYLIDFYNVLKRKKDTYSLRKAIQNISSIGNIDLIIFVGKLSFFQILLFKVPFKIEPRHLHFMVDIINPNKIINSELLYEFKNWDFGLFNYDVR